MANVKITDMPQATTIGGDDIIPIVQGGINKQVTTSLATSFSQEYTIIKYFDGIGSGKTINTTKVVLASGTKTFTGGTYLIATQQILLTFSNTSFQLNFYLSVDGVDTEVYTVAKLGYGSQGSLHIISTAEISEGEHTIEFYAKTNNSGKTATIPRLCKL